MSKLETNTIDNISGSSTLTIGDSNTSTITLKSGAPLTNFPDNTPAFFVHNSSNQTLTDATTTKVTLDSEDYDTDNAFASSRFTVPSGEAGKYLFYTAIDCHGGGGSLLDSAYVYIYKNGSSIGELAQDERNNPARRISVTATFSLDLAVSDYIEIYANIDRNSGGNGFIVGDSGITTYLGGHKLIGV